ncbi:MAG: CopG family transcriptional regulator [Deltaproteobacteria bacterium]|nr:CopG family transcriptional regulator [Deltaproteobacteria bacterium]
MKKKIKYTNEPMGVLKVVEDFLPPPHELVFKKENMKVTISLSRASIEFFKRKAKEQHTQYQKMIRKLIDLYTLHYQ